MREREMIPVADTSKDKKKARDKKIKVDSGVNLPNLIFFFILGTIFMSLLTMFIALAGFMLSPPLTSIAAALAAAALSVPLYLLLIYASGTRSVPAARAVAGISGLLIGYAHVCMAISAAERFGAEAPPEGFLGAAGVLIRDLFQRYLLHPSVLLEDTLYHGDGWVFVMLAGILAMLGAGQLSTGGVSKRFKLALELPFDDMGNAPDVVKTEEPDQDGEPEKKKKKEKKGKKK